jgi:hypothetical protein
LLMQCCQLDVLFTWNCMQTILIWVDSYSKMLFVFFFTVFSFLSILQLEGGLT